MINYWSSINDRERWMLGGGALCVLVYLLYLLVFSPLASMVASKTKQLQEKEETLTWMQGIQAQSMNAKEQKSVNSSKLLTIIATELSNPTFANFPHQIQQTSQGDIQSSFEAVPYTPFLTWLWTLGNEYTITVKQLSIEHTDTPGVVKIMLVIDAGSWH